MIQTLHDGLSISSKTFRACPVFSGRQYFILFCPYPVRKVLAHGDRKTGDEVQNSTMGPAVGFSAAIGCVAVWAVVGLWVHGLARTLRGLKWGTRYALTAVCVLQCLLSVAHTVWCGAVERVLASHSVHTNVRIPRRSIVRLLKWRSYEPQLKWSCSRLAAVLCVFFVEGLDVGKCLLHPRTRASQRCAGRFRSYIGEKFEHAEAASLILLQYWEQSEWWAAVCRMPRSIVLGLAARAVVTQCWRPGTASPEVLQAGALLFFVLLSITTHTLDEFRQWVAGGEGGMKFGDRAYGRAPRMVSLIRCPAVRAAGLHRGSMATTVRIAVCAVWLLHWRLVLAGDIEPNPGPPMRISCRIGQLNRCGACGWRESFTCPVTELNTGLCRPCNELSATCQTCDTLFPAGYFQHLEPENGERRCSSARTLRRIMPLFLVLEDVIAREVGPQATQSIDLVCRPCFLRLTGKHNLGGAVLALCPARPAPLFEELCARQVDCKWCRCLAWVPSEATMAEDGDQIGCTLCKDGDQAMPEDFWKEHGEAVDDLVNALRYFSPEVIARANDSIALMRYQFDPKQSKEAPTKFVGYRADDYQEEGFLHSHGTGLWCPQYLRKALGIGVYLARASGEANESGSVKAEDVGAIGLRSLRASGSPIYTSAAFEQYIGAPDSVSGLEFVLQGACGGISGVVLRESPAPVSGTFGDGVFVPRDHAEDIQAGEIFQKHEYLSEQWRKLTDAEFPFLFPIGTERAPHIEFDYFMRQYFSRPCPAIFAELQQVLLIRRELNVRQLAALEAKRRAGFIPGGIPRLPETVPGSYAAVRAARSVAFAMVRAFGPADLFVTITMSEFWAEVKAEAARVDPSGEKTFVMLDQAAATSRAYHAKMAELTAQLAAIYGPIRGVSWSHEFQHRGTPHRHMLIWLASPVVHETGFDGLIRRDRAWLEGHPEWKRMAEHTLTHVHGSGCCPADAPHTRRTPGGGREPVPGFQCEKRFPASLQAVTYLDADGFLQVLTMPGDEEHIPMDVLLFPRLICHVCTVGTGGARKVKYLIKYSAKRGNLGSRRGDAKKVQAWAREDKMNEVQVLEEAQVLSASEAAQGLFGQPYYEHEITGGKFLRAPVGVANLTDSVPDGWDMAPFQIKGNAARGGAPTLVNHWLERPDVFAGFSFARYLIWCVPLIAREAVSVAVNRFGYMGREFRDARRQGITLTRAEVLNMLHDDGIPYLIRKQFAQALGVSIMNDEGTRQPPRAMVEEAIAQFLADGLQMRNSVPRIVSETREDTFLTWLCGTQVVRREDVDAALADPADAMQRFAYPAHLATMVFAHYLQELQTSGIGGNLEQEFVDYWPNFTYTQCRVAWAWLREDAGHIDQVRERDRRIVDLLHAAGYEAVEILPGHPGSEEEHAVDTSGMPVFDTEEGAWQHFATKIRRSAACAGKKAAAGAALTRLLEGGADGRALTPGQRDCVRYLVEGDADIAVVNEAAGAGKAWVIDAVAQYYASKGEIVLLLGASGQAAVVIGGQTLHFGGQLTIDLVQKKDAATIRVLCLLALAKVVVVDEWALANASWLRALEERAVQVVNMLAVACGTEKPAAGTSWGGKRLILFGDTYQLPSILRAASLSETLAASYSSTPAIEYLQGREFTRVRIDNGDWNPRYMNQEWSQHLGRIRTGEEREVDLTQFGRVGEGEEEEYSYDWLEALTAGATMEEAQRREIIVGTHRERRRALRRARAGWTARGIRSTVYPLHRLNETDPLWEGFEDFDALQVEDVTIFAGERICLTRPFRVADRTYPTQTRATVQDWGRTYIRVVMADTGVEERIPVTATTETEPDDPSASWLLVSLGVRSALVSTAHSFQGRTVPLENILVWSLATTWILHGFLYQVLSRVREAAQMFLYRASEVAVLENIVDAGRYCFDALLRPPANADGVNGSGQSSSTGSATENLNPLLRRGMVDHRQRGAAGGNLTSATGRTPGAGEMMLTWVPDDGACFFYAVAAALERIGQPVQEGADRRTQGQMLRNLMVARLGAKVGSGDIPLSVLASDHWSGSDAFRTWLETWWHGTVPADVHGVSWPMLRAYLERPSSFVSQGEMECLADALGARIDIWKALQPGSTEHIRRPGVIVDRAAHYVVSALGDLAADVGPLPVWYNDVDHYWAVEMGEDVEGGPQ